MAESSFNAPPFVRSGYHLDVMRKARDPRSLFLTPLGWQRIGWWIIFRSWAVLRPVADLYRRFFLRGTRFVAVVGSYGKTTAARAAMAALGLPYERHIGWNSRGHVPHLVLRTTPRTPHCVIEAGISSRGWMARYARFIRPQIVVVTSIGSEHARSLGTLEGTRAEKAIMVRALPPSGLAVLNGDDPHVRWMRTQTQARVLTYGFGEDNDLRASDVQLDPSTGMRFRVHAGGGTYDASVELVGRHMVYPILSAVAVASEEGISVADALHALGTLRPAYERLQPLRSTGGTLLLLDSDKGAVETIEAGIDVLREFPLSRKAAVLGEVEEPPGPQGPIYRQLGRELASVVDLIVFVGSSRAYASIVGGWKEGGAPKARVVHAGRSAAQAAAIVRERLGEYDVIWIKGRSTQHLGRVGLALAGRDVTCDLVFCPHTPTCEICPMLERRRRFGLPSRSTRQRESEDEADGA
jgi:UDP-N-acetylmuramyl pentapeptide synthase